MTAHYEVQIRIHDNLTNTDSWESVRPSNGPPYKLETAQKAHEFIRSWYRNTHETDIRIIRIEA